MQLKQFFDSKKISYKEESGGKELRIICPHCKNEHQKCYVNSSSGNWYCHHCGYGGGFKHLSEQLRLDSTGVDLNLHEDTSEWDLVTPIDEEAVQEHHLRLMKALDSDEGIQKYIFTKRGYTFETVKKFKLGWGRGANVIIPIYDSSGRCLNFKMKSDPTRPLPAKGMISIEGRGKKRLFNEGVLLAKTKKDTERVIICEGEWDCMLLDQMGYSAVTSTGGVRSFDESWIPAFTKFNKVYVCFDNDRNGAGQEGTKKVAEMFYKKGIRVFVIQLPPPMVMEDNVDVTDFFTTRKKVKADFTQLLKDATEYAGGDIAQEQYRIVDFSVLMERDYPPQRWLVDHLIPADGLTCIAGLPGTMKSYFSNYLAGCIAQNKKVLGMFDVAKVPILLIDKENNPARIQTRMKSLQISPEAFKNNLYYWDRGEFMVEKENSIQVAENMIQKYGIKLTIIDTMVRIHSKSENDASEMNRVYQALRRLQLAGSAVLFIHHFNRSGSSGMFKTTDIKQLLRGSGDILGWLDSYFALQIVENGLLRLDVGKSRDEKPIKSFFIEPGFYENETTFNYMGEVQEDEVYKQMAVEELIKRELLSTSSLSRKDIIKKLASQASPSTIDRGLKKMKQTEELITVQNSHKTYYSLSNKLKAEVLNGMFPDADNQEALDDLFN